MTFEETYPRHAFSELVRLGLAAGKIVVRFRKWWVTAEKHLLAMKPWTAKSAH